MSRAKRKRRKKAASEQGKKEWMFVFAGGKQKRVRRPVLIEGLEVDEFIRQNADPVWLHANEMWELIEPMDFPGTEADGVQREDEWPEIPF